MLTLVASALAGGDCIDDADVLRTGGTACTLGGTVKAPSTLGTFLRSFRWGHVRQLDRVSRQLLARAWQAGAGPGDGPMTIDLDSTICETYGLHGDKLDYAYMESGYWMHPGLPWLRPLLRQGHCGENGWHRVPWLVSWGRCAGNTWYPYSHQAALLAYPSYTKPLHISKTLSAPTPLSCTWVTMTKRVC